MRWIMIATLAVACAETPPAESPRELDAATQRALVTDNLPFGVDRETTRTWHDRNDWCRRRTWPTTDEFAICNRHPYMQRNTPPMYTLARFDANNHTIAYATFTPVPCRLYGRCDVIYGRTVYAAEHDFVDHEHGLRDHLVDRGRAAGSGYVDIPSMQQRMIDALGDELRRRYGQPQWQDPHGYGATWTTPTEDIGLFVAGGGGWVAETHELRGVPPSLAVD
jgi:hypothetical protein